MNYSDLRPGDALAILPTDVAGHHPDFDVARIVLATSLSEWSGGRTADVDYLLIGGRRCGTVERVTYHPETPLSGWWKVVSS